MSEPGSQGQRSVESASRLKRSWTELSAEFNYNAFLPNSSSVSGALRPPISSIIEGNHSKIQGAAAAPEISPRVFPGES
jgi:hypothetical protein